mgnify:CR=1 FL=1
MLVRRDRPYPIGMELLVIVALAIGIIGCSESEGSGQRLSFNESDYGSRAVIEVGDEFDITLLANALYPLEPWEIEVAAPAVVEVAWQEHETGVRAIGDWSVSDEQASPDTGLYLPMTVINFEGVELGESQLVLIVKNGPEIVDRFEAAVLVVQDACSYKDGWHLTRVPARCF